METPIIAPDHLGDGAYASFDGYHLILTANHHDPALATDKVAFDPHALTALKRYIARLEAAIEAVG
jgi:hypothetical protein